MKLSEISQWIALLTKGSLDDGVNQFGKKVSELAGRDLVRVKATDPRFERLDLEYNPSDKARLLLVDAHFEKPEPVSYDQLVTRFGKDEPIQPPVDDFSGETQGSHFLFSEGKERFSLSVFYAGKPEETVEMTRISLRRTLPLFPPKDPPRP